MYWFGVNTLENIVVCCFALERDSMFVMIDCYKYEFSTNVIYFDTYFCCLTLNPEFSSQGDMTAGTFLHSKSYLSKSSFSTAYLIIKSKHTHSAGKQPM